VGLQALQQLSSAFGMQSLSLFLLRCHIKPFTTFRFQYQYKYVAGMIIMTGLHTASNTHPMPPDRLLLQQQGHCTS
jgi:hypothetical protein